MANAHPVTPDPVKDLLVDLESTLRGPRRARRHLITEARAGLDDAVRAYLGVGLTPAQARAKAVAEFGTVGELRGAYQDVLAAAQGRRLLATLVAMATVIPLWDLMFATASSIGRPNGPEWLLFSHNVTGGVSIAAAIVGGALLRLGARHGRSPRRVVRALAATCLLTVLAHILAGLATWLPQLPFAARVAAGAPLAPVVLAAVALVVGLVARSTLSALATCDTTASGHTEPRPASEVSPGR